MEKGGFPKGFNCAVSFQTGDVTQNLVSEGRGTAEPGGKQGAIFVCVYPYLDMLLYFPRDQDSLLRPPIIIHADNHISA